MSFVANVKADFKALPQRLRSEAMPKIIVGLNLGLYLLWWVAFGVDGELDELVVWAVLVLVVAPAYLITTYLVLSKRLKITLTVILGLLILWFGFLSLGDGVPRSLVGILVVSSVLPFPAINILFLWAWTPKYRVRRWDVGVVNTSGVSEEKLYATVWEELESGNIQKGLWAKLWSDNRGDEDKTKAAYLKERVSQLLDEVVDDETSITPAQTTTSENDGSNSDSWGTNKPPATKSRAIKRGKTTKGEWYIVCFVIGCLVLFLLLTLIPGEIGDRVKSAGKRGFYLGFFLGIPWLIIALTKGTFLGRPVFGARGKASRLTDTKSSPTAQPEQDGVEHEFETCRHCKVYGIIGVALLLVAIFFTLRS